MAHNRTHRKRRGIVGQNISSNKSNSTGIKNLMCVDDKGNHYLVDGISGYFAAYRKNPQGGTGGGGGGGPKYPEPFQV